MKWPLIRLIGITVDSGNSGRVHNEVATVRVAKSTVAVAAMKAMESSDGGRGLARVHIWFSLRHFFFWALVVFSHGIWEPKCRILSTKYIDCFTLIW